MILEGTGFNKGAASIASGVPAGFSDPFATSPGCISLFHGSCAPNPSFDTVNTGSRNRKTPDKRINKVSNRMIPVLAKHHVSHQLLRDLLTSSPDSRSTIPQPLRLTYPRNQIIVTIVQQRLYNVHPNSIVWKRTQPSQKHREDQLGNRRR